MDALQEKTALKRIGETAYNNLNEKMTIIKYIDCNNVVVKFENGFIANVQYGNFKRGAVKSQDDASKRVGEISYNNSGEKMKIVKYIKSNKVVIEFESGYITTKTYRAFKRGEVRNPYHKSIYGVGFIGEGKYKVRINNKISKCYKTFSHMMSRCYDLESYEKKHSYSKCTVCEEWHNFQNFAEWYDENFYQIPNELMCLDKDILIKGNKIYSPNTCVFVPKNINNLFTKDEARRGEQVIGVTKDKSGSYRAQYNIDGKITYLGAYRTPENAFKIYKHNKETLIKEIADKYKDKIPQKLYNAMYRYEVEITD